ncbi:MAG: double zinc ribbon domain-containing protein [Candidatus Korobacteraceae bacterium]|jgi:RNA polymerase subunit RPABC4/transcription elongation factor Spt4
MTVTERRSRLQQELRIIPLGWTVAAAIGIIVVEALFQFVIPHFAHNDLPPWPWFDVIGALGALFLAATILLTGYIYADAKRRGMNAVLWTVLVLLIPKPIGFIAYFLLRSPMLAPCPKCSAPVGADFTFCPKCGYALTPSCTGCGRAIRRDYACCPYCGKTVGAAVSSSTSPDTSTG